MYMRPVILSTVGGRQKGERKDMGMLSRKPNIGLRYPSNRLMRGPGSCSFLKCRQQTAPTLLRESTFKRREIGKVTIQGIGRKAQRSCHASYRELLYTVFRHLVHGDRQNCLPVGLGRVGHTRTLYILTLS